MAPAAAARAVADQHRGARPRRHVPGGELTAILGRDPDLLVRDAERSLVDRPPRGVAREVRERERREDGERDHHAARHPAGGVRDARRESGATRAASGRGDGGEAGRDQREAAGDVADAGHVAPVGAGVDDVQAVRGDAEPGGEQPDGDAEREPGRPGQVGLGERPGERRGEDGEHPERRRVGAREREVEEVRRDEREPGEKQRSLKAGEAGGRHAVTIAVRLRPGQPAGPWRRGLLPGVAAVRPAARDPAAPPGRAYGSPPDVGWRRRIRLGVRTWVHVSSPEMMRAATTCANG